MTGKLKVMTIQGTRPETIRLSETMKSLDKYTTHVMVHTNQNYDYQLNGVFFKELGLRQPDYLLNVKADSVGQQIGNILTQCEAVMLKEKPDAILVLGDTNSALSCIVAKRLGIVIFHMEAGNRCFDDRVPEEINRRIVDHTSDVNLCYTEHARRNLLREGIHPQRMFVVGSPLPEVYAVHKQEIRQSLIRHEMSLQKYFLASIHREETVNNKGRLGAVMEAFHLLAETYDMPVVMSCHPRTKSRLIQLGLDHDDKVILHEPFGMFDYIKLQRHAFCNLSDSGTIHEDAAILNIPAVNIRDVSERPEVYDKGNVVMAGFDVDTIMNAVAMVRSQIDVVFERPYDYWGVNCSAKVARLIVGMTKSVAKRVYVE